MNSDGSSQGARSVNHMPVATIGDIYPGDLGKRIFGTTDQPSGIAATGGVDDVSTETHSPAYSLLGIVGILVLVRVLWEIAK